MNMPGPSSKSFGEFLVDYGVIEQKKNLRPVAGMRTRKTLSGKSFPTRNLFSAGKA